MNKNCIFTICAKNYLAQAFTLKESVLENNKGLDFFIFLSDLSDKEEILSDVVLLEDSWVNNWKEMAFKYDVVEFSTAIKPFAIKKLFNEGYDKVCYLDPDIYVKNSLDYIFDTLNTYSSILTPHRCSSIREGELIDEHAVILNGIFNLGFFGVKNNDTGNHIIDWWSNKLTDLCYLDLWDGLAVDQKWMEFIPAYYPHETLISHHLGMNAASWNLQERTLTHHEGQYILESKIHEKKKYDLLFWHFSSYNPLTPNYLEKGNPSSNLENYPALHQLSEEYSHRVINNGYQTYSKMHYSFKTYDNGDVILPLHRRLFRHYEKELHGKGDMFKSDNFYYVLLKRNKLISKKSFVKLDVRRDKDIAQTNMERDKNVARKLLKCIHSLIGIDRYMLLIKAAGKIGKYDFHSFLIEDL